MHETIETLPKWFFLTLGNCIEIDSDGGTFWIGSLPCIQRTSAVRAPDPEWELFLRAWEGGRCSNKITLIMLQYWLDRCRFTRWRPTLRGLSSSTGCCKSGRCWGTRRMLSRFCKFSLFFWSFQTAEHQNWLKQKKIIKQIHHSSYLLGLRWCCRREESPVLARPATGTIKILHLFSALFGYREKFKKLGFKTF